MGKGARGRRAGGSDFAPPWEHSGTALAIWECGTPADAERIREAGNRLRRHAERYRPVQLERNFLVVRFGGAAAGCGLRAALSPTSLA